METGISRERLQHLGTVTSTYPEVHATLTPSHFLLPQNFNVHPLLAKILRGRKKSIDEGKSIDWATAEAMAFGSLLQEKTHVRLSGQVIA